MSDCGRSAGEETATGCRSVVPLTAESYNHGARMCVPMPGGLCRASSTPDS